MASSAAYNTKDQFVKALQYRSTAGACDGRLAEVYQRIFGHFCDSILKQENINHKEEKNMENKYYIIRGDRSGVFFGQIAGRNGQEVKLRNVRKLWYWEGACAVEQLAVDGVAKLLDCKFTVVVPEMLVTDAIQILPCSDKAAKILGEAKAWKC